MGLDKPYLDIPGTTIFDADQARKGYHLNQFATSLMVAENRERFSADERAYLDEWDMTEDQKQAVIDRDFNRLLELGGNIYYVAKVGATDGLSYVEIVSSMTENDAEGHQAMMVAGGRSPDGNRYLHEWDGGGPGGVPHDRPATGEDR